MIEGFCIDRVFRQALDGWRAFVRGVDATPVALRLSGAEGSLLPEVLTVEFPEAERELATRWPEGTPRTRRDLRTDHRVWELFLREWSLDEIASYLEVQPDTPEADIRGAFVESDWWQEFEEMVVEAYRYEWRSTLERLAPVNGTAVSCSIETPTADASGLDVFERRLRDAALRFEANHLDAQLLYGDNARIVGFLHLAAADG